MFLENHLLLIVLIINLLFQMSNLAYIVWNNRKIKQELKKRQQIFQHYLAARGVE